ncbi:hypothetical protein [Jannaschia seosinensis]|uniref:hypothetical protein n=1 Tax=Jannaschia seosinensis TaxID=313367 RepID=UPI0006E2E233|nr:hypothetical protein [Jannaschia seosinensis]
MKDNELDALSELVALKEQKTGHRLARIQALIDQLEGKAQVLRDTPGNAEDDFGAAILHDRWQRWRGQQLAVLNEQLARLHAAAQPERERHAHNVARRNVVEKLRDQALADRRARRP